MEDWPEEKKRELLRRRKILETRVFPPEMPMEDFARIVETVDANPPTGGLLSELEKVIYRALEKSKIVLDHESRLSAIEERLKAAPEPEAEYPAESSGGASYPKEAEPVFQLNIIAKPEARAGTVVFHDDIAAGLPIWQFTDSGRVVDVPLHLIKTKESDYYALRVLGNSMIDARIPDGSMVLIKTSDVPKNGKIQVVRIDDRVTLKRMREEEDHSWTLCYEDGTGRTIPLGEENMVQGDFVAVLPPFTQPKMRE